MEFPFDESIPRHWFAGNPVATHVINGLNLLFPAGERFFVRSVRRYLTRISDPELRAQIKGFSGQEGRHAHEHERYFRTLEAQGYEIRRFLERYERFVYGFLERVLPASVNLAGTAACEHFTATLAEMALTEKFLDRAHPVMRDLLRWHAAEEIEHKAVAFDVLREFHPSHAIRMVGLAFATICLTAFWIDATRMLLAQDGLSRKELKAALREFLSKQSLGGRVFSKGIREYTERDFHPWNKDNLRLATEYLASIGRAAA